MRSPRKYGPVEGGEELSSDVSDEDSHYCSWRLPDFEEWQGDTYTDNFTITANVKITAKRDQSNKNAGEGLVEILCNDAVIHQMHHYWNTPKEYEYFAEAADFVCFLLQDHLPLLLIVLGHQAYLLEKQEANETGRPITLQSIDFKGVVYQAASRLYLDVIKEDMPLYDLLCASAGGWIRSGQSLPNGDFIVQDYSRGEKRVHRSEQFHLTAAQLDQHAQEIGRQVDQFFELARAIYSYKQIPPPIVKLPDIYEIVYPIVKSAQKEARKMIKEGVKDWAKRILDDDRFSDFRSERDLVYRLSGNVADVTETEIALIGKQGASISAAKDIALELAARVCNTNEYQYSIKRLREFQQGKSSMQTRVRRKE